MTEVQEHPVETALKQEIIQEQLVIEKDGKSFYVTKDLYKGQHFWIQVVPVNPMLMRMALVSVKMPKRPMYEARTGGGRVELHPLDEISSLENNLDKARWEVYEEERDEALSERTNASMRATFYYGTVFTPPDDGWDEDQRLLGIDVPANPELRKAHFLMSMLSMQDMQGLMRAITRSMGVSEEAIKAAEDSFRD